ncbi:hypothetical protein BC834DRAFT_843342 [Gloeopeniophorella convolvens]|nr:hypothetical protein BC834DRAFT_843342 [Gloeopeniophorella convolvens]
MYSFTASLTSLAHEPLPAQDGDIVRVAPNELHFSNPSAYNDIYNSQNKWDKDYQLYKAFDADMSFFTQVKYADSKRNRTLVSNSFSRQAIYKLQSLVIDKARHSVYFD